MDDLRPAVKATVLFVDDEKHILETLKRCMRKSVFECLFANSGAEALDLMENHMVDVVVSDMMMPEMTGEELLREISHRYPETIRIVLSAYSEDEMVMNAINQGHIWGFIHKPWGQNDLIQTITQAASTQRVIAERALLKRTLDQYELQTKAHFEGFVGSSVSMQFVYKAIEKAAPSSASVMVTGESGTGKEVAARALHQLSKRHDKPFVALNCAAIPSELMESEIFGHVKGAFSGAVNNRDGAATRADGGTLFLDELSEMDISLQSKLLRFIQLGTFQKVGSNTSEHVDIRFICATNRDPIEAIQERKLREDLYYRLNVVPLHLPPLRQREGDALTLAQAFLSRFSDQEDKVIVGFSSDAEQLVLNYEWPGNVRQLENAVHSAVVMSNGPLVTGECLAGSLGLRLSDVRHAKVFSDPTEVSKISQSGTIVNLPRNVGSHTSDSKATDDIIPLAQIEERAIKQAIGRCDGNVVKAAGLLEVSPSTLYRKIQAWESDKQKSQ